jgi:ubiquinone/menaquinone biosynthesis C-methylase UbiE
LPHAQIDVVDFSPRMVEYARKRLGHKNVSYILGDYSKIRFTNTYDIIISVIGVHHQNTAGKKRLFKKIYNLLSQHGVFIFGDLITYRNPRVAALNHALHYHHLVKMTKSPKTLTDWAYHHLYLNDLAPIEDQEQWLKAAGYHVKIAFIKMNTALLICIKGKDTSL